MAALPSNVSDTAANVTTIVGWVAALIGLYYTNRRYKHSVDVASQRNRRAEVELAIRQCTHFGTILLPKMAGLRQEIEKSAPNFFSRFKIVHGKGRIDPDDKEVTKEDIEGLKPHWNSIVEVLNSFEGFAIPFAAKVADDRIGYIECAPAFLEHFAHNFALYSKFDLSSRYPATQHLYFKWKDEAEAADRQAKLAATSEAFFAATKEILRKDAKSNRGRAALLWCELLESLLAKARRR